MSKPRAPVHASRPARAQNTRDAQPSEASRSSESILRASTSPASPMRPGSRKEVRRSSGQKSGTTLTVTMLAVHWAQVSSEMTRDETHRGQTAVAKLDPDHLMGQKGLAG